MSSCFVWFILTANLSIQPSIHPPVLLSFCLSVHAVSNQSSIRSSLCTSCPSVCLTIYPSIHPSIHLSISPFIPRSIQQAILYFYPGTKTLNVQRSRQDIIRKQLLKFSCPEKNMTGRKISISNTRKQPRLGRSRQK